ncbi:hypothetical protein RIF29_05885 [Crotalaria pallida]|uniref:Uncharacterized protein n=1 Tax=Crotalaria pallida TaxID=3830 RepID=A0AAN9PAX2_CROPI
MKEKLSAYRGENVATRRREKRFETYRTLAHSNKQTLIEYEMSQKANGNVIVTSEKLQLESTLFMYGEMAQLDKWDSVPNPVVDSYKWHKSS